MRKYDSFPVVRHLLGNGRNPYKRHRKCLWELQVRLMRGNRAGGAGAVSPQWCLEVLRRLLLPVTEQPKGDEAAQGTGHQQVWFWAPGKNCSKVRRDPSCAHCVSAVVSSP